MYECQNVSTYKCVLQGKEKDFVNQKKKREKDLSGVTNFQRKVVC